MPLPQDWNTLGKRYRNSTVNSPNCNFSPNKFVDCERYLPTTLFHCCLRTVKDQIRIHSFNESSLGKCHGKKRAQSPRQIVAKDRSPYKIVQRTIAHPWWQKWSRMHHKLTMSLTPSTIVWLAQQPQSATIYSADVYFLFVFFYIEMAIEHTLSPAQRETSEIGRNANKTGSEPWIDRHEKTIAV